MIRGRFGTEVGPLIEEAAAKRLRDRSESARQAGQVLATRRISAREGWYVEPMLVADLPLDNELLHEELFGPLLTVEEVESIEEACARVDAFRSVSPAGSSHGTHVPSTPSRDCLRLGTYMSTVEPLARSSLDNRLADVVCPEPARRPAAATTCCSSLIRSS